MVKPPNVKGKKIQLYYNKAPRAGNQEKIRKNLSPGLRRGSHGSILEELLRQGQPEERRDRHEVLRGHGLLCAARREDAQVDVRSLLHAVHEAEGRVKVLARGKGAVEGPDRHVVLLHELAGRLGDLRAAADHPGQHAHAAGEDHRALGHGGPERPRPDDVVQQNKMTVEDYYIEGKRIDASEIDPSIPLHKDLMRLSILCNDSSNVDGQEIGDPTETALINLSAHLGVPASRVRAVYPRLSEIPFDSDRKMMSTLHLLKDGYTMITKGAVDVLIERIKYVRKNNQIVPITAQDREDILAMNMEFSQNGLRVLAITYKKLTAEKSLDYDDENDLIFLGLISMMDPPRVESAPAVTECLQAGITPIMITGDHKITAAAIAKRIGILTDISQAVEGSEIDGLSDEELKTYVEDKRVYARVSPEHKIRIVRAWQEKGNIVAMTGDGVNDAPALKQADIGVAMGITGSEVSKDAAAMVLTDDNFATIIKAVENGRNVYANIKDAIQFLLSGNFGGILAVLYASIMALPVPFAPVHLLFINLLTDSLPAIALGLEPHNAGVMKEKPRPMNESILTKPFLASVGIEGFVIAVMTMVGFMIGYQESALLASTMAFGTLCLSRLVHGYNCKSKSPVLFKKSFFNNKYLQGAFLVGFILITLVLTMPLLQSMFKVQTLNIEQLMIVYGLALANLPVIQFIKYLRNR